MLKSNKSVSFSSTSSSFDTNAIDRIAEGTTLEGNLKSSKGIRIDGIVKGSVTCEGKVVVGKNGVIEGEVTCQSADIEGTLKSTIIVKDILELKATSNLHGEITTGKLSIEPGATFTGNCKMGGVIKGIHKEEKKEVLAAEKTA